jgi:hypothetical protein
MAGCEFKALLQPSFLMMISGSTGSGKSEFFKNLLHSPHLFAKFPDKIYIVYQANPMQYKSLHSISGLEICSTLPDVADIDTTKHTLIIIDDATQVIANKKHEIIDLFCVRCHHSNISTIIVVHNPYIKELRTARLNTGYHVLFRNLNDSSYITKFAHQTHPGRAQQFLNAFKKACSVPYGYIMYDAHPSVDDRDRLRGCILDVPQHVYMDNSYL